MTTIRQTRCKVMTITHLILCIRWAKQLFFFFFNNIIFIQMLETYIMRVQPLLKISMWNLIIHRFNKINCELMLTFDTPALRQTGSRNLTVKKRFPRYGVPIWSLWPNIRFLPSIVADKNATKNGHIQNVCSMCIKINCRQTGSRNLMVPKTLPIWSLWPNIRSLPSIVAETNVTKNVHIRGLSVKFVDYLNKIWLTCPK